VPKLVVDHHLTQESWADAKLVITQAAAAGEIAAELLDRWGVAIDQPIAAALFLAIASDTAGFNSPTRGPLHAAIGRAVHRGRRRYRLPVSVALSNERAERLALQTRALQSLELLLDGRLAVMRVRKEDFDQTKANVPDTENLINVPLQVRTVQVSILIVEPRDGGPVRISLRSKGQVDVAAFAEQFGGGGHARAAGLKLAEDFQQAHDRVIAAMSERLGKP